MHGLFHDFRYLTFYKEAAFSGFQIWFTSKLICKLLHAFLAKLLHPSLLIVEKEVIHVSFREV